MHRALLVPLVLLGWLVGCTGPLNECQKDGTCLNGGVCDPGTNLCFVGTGENEVACEPRCAGYQACATTTRTCAPRYTGLVVTPASGTVVGGSALSVRAELRVAEGFTANYPERLSFTVLPEGGGAGVALTAVTNEGGGVYTAQWTPQGEGAFRVTAAHPEAGGPSATVALTVDTTAPVFQVRVPAADAGVLDGGAVYGDPSPGFATAWRRDQVVPVEVRTNEPHLERGSVTVALQGTDGVTASPVSATAFSEGCDAGYCGRAELKLWEPAFAAFHGPLPIVVRASDRAGNTGGAAPSEVNVTRWKWRYDIASAVITAAPAVGNTGVLYVGTTNGGGTDGQMVALSPDGRLLWATSTGAVTASPTVGNTRADGTERVYTAHKKGSVIKVGFHDGATGAFTTPCTDLNSSSASVQSSFAFAPGIGGSETAYGVYTGRAGGTLFAIRPDKETDPLVQCPGLGGVGDVATPGTMLASGGSVIFGVTSGALKSYALSSNGDWSGSLQWNQPINPLKPTSLAAAQGRVFGGGNDGSNSKLFDVPLDGSRSPTYVPTLAPSWNVSIGGVVSKAVVGVDDFKLFGLNVSDGVTEIVNTPDNVIRGAPV